MKTTSAFLSVLLIVSCARPSLDDKAYRTRNTLRDTRVVDTVVLGPPGEEIVYPSGFAHYGDTFALTDPAYAQACFLFHADGRLRVRVGGSGSGPGEYTMPWAFTRGAEHLFVMSGGDKKTLVYDLDGTFQTSASRPFTGIIQSLAPHPDGAIGTVFSRYCAHTLFTVDPTGAVVRRLSPRPEAMNHFFDTLWPAGGLVFEPEKERMLQFFNFAYEIHVLDLDGRAQEVLRLASTAYRAPDLEAAARVEGARAEKAFRTTFTAFAGLHRLADGYVTVLMDVAADGEETERLELWDAGFHSLGYVVVPDRKFLGTHDGRLVFFDQTGDAPRLVFHALSEHPLLGRP